MHAINMSVFTLYLLVQVYHIAKKKYTGGSDNLDIHPRQPQDLEPEPNHVRTRPVSGADSSPAGEMKPHPGLF